MKPSTGFEDGSTLVNGNLEKKGFGMGIATGMYNSVLLRLPKGAADPQLVRIWQRGGGSDNAGCCFSRLKDIEVVYNNTCTGASAVAAYPSQPSNFAELNLGPERFLWIAGEWLPSICPANQPCGTVPTTRRQNVSCVGDKGTHASSDAECSESGDRPTANHSCPRAPCCIEFGQTMEIRYVSPGGDDSRSGCDPSQPLRSLASCIASSSQPTLAVTCRLLPGSYREEVLVQGQDDLTIELAPESEWPAGSSASAALMDGTETITFESEALVDANGPFYRSTAPTEAWQLFMKEKMLTPARWPNAAAWSEEAWSRSKGWASQAAGTFCGHSEDAGTANPAQGEAGHQSLATTGVSFDGCNAIVNNEHWNTRRYLVVNHTAGTGSFDYEVANDNSLCKKYGADLRAARYFLDGCQVGLSFSRIYCVCHTCVGSTYLEA